ncbi:MAG TPA: isochorismatase family cysteine hydrolase [Mycobacteriales bacterium]|nr:isochorismatase family cysteine hydrolase [Mycobacteriales bacterium]
MQLPTLPAALLVIDVQLAFCDGPEWPQRIVRIEQLADAWRAASLPVIFTQEVHRASGIDFGRELDGAEDVHCLDDDPRTGLALGPRPGDHVIVKRRYSCFIGTDLDILLRALDVRTVVLTGALTDVCVHYTFADAHQRDLHARVVTDCVGGSSTAASDAALNAMRYLQRDAWCTAAELADTLSVAVPC